MGIVLALGSGMGQAAGHTSTRAFSKAWEHSLVLLMTGLDWLIVLVLNGGVAAYGIYLSRGIRTSGEWFLGRRALAWWVVGLSMLATNVDNADLVSLTGTSSTEGLHIITVHTLGGAIGAILAAFYAVPAMYRAGLYTNAEYLEARFGPATRVMSALIQIQYRTSMLGLMIWSIHLLLTGMLGLSPGVAWGLVGVMVLVAAVYTAWGGLKSVAFTDAAQGIIMLTAMMAILGAVWHAAGGWAGMTTALESVTLGSGRPGGDLAHVGRYHGDAGTTPSLVVVVGWVIIGAGYWTVNHTQTMRLLGSRSLWDMKMAAVFGVGVSIPIMVGCALLGVLGRSMVPEFEPADQLYPYLADRYLGMGLKGLVVAGIMASGISTFDSMGSSLSALFTRDVYGRFFARDREDDHYLRVTRWVTVMILALGFLYIPFISSKDTMLKAFLTLIPVFVTPLFTLYLLGVFTPVHRRSGVVGLVCGGLYGLLALYDREVANLDWLPGGLTGRWEALGWSVLVTGSAMLGATLIWGRQRFSGELRLEATGWLRRSRAELPPPREHPFEGGVPIGLRPGWFAIALLVGTAYLVFGLFW